MAWLLSLQIVSQVPSLVGRRCRSQSISTVPYSHRSEHLAGATNWLNYLPSDRRNRYISVLRLLSILSLIGTHPDPTAHLPEPRVLCGDSGGSPSYHGGGRPSGRGQEGGSDGRPELSCTPDNGGPGSEGGTVGLRFLPEGVCREPRGTARRNGF